MRCKIKNKIRNCLIIFLCLAINPSLALKEDVHQPIHVTSVKQALDMNGNTVTFTDRVIIRQGTIEIHADRVIVTRPDGDQNKTVIEGFGNPVTFVQIQDDGKPIKGHGQTLRYEVANEFVVLSGDAYLEQLDSNIKGDRIIYRVQLKQMEAFSDEGKQVTTILLPAQPDDKNQQNSSQNKSH